MRGRSFTVASYEEESTARGRVESRKTEQSTEPDLEKRGGGEDQRGPRSSGLQG